MQGEFRQSEMFPNGGDVGDDLIDPYPTGATKSGASGSGKILN